MTSSLVGSEMCIRDRVEAIHSVLAELTSMAGEQVVVRFHSDAGPEFWNKEAVSYTHLTLPTICSV
eukprot:4658039-Prorocentrum_lima.AAC.1